MIMVTMLLLIGRLRFCTVKLYFFAVSSTLSRVSSDMPGSLFNTHETVLADTLHIFAISSSVFTSFISFISYPYYHILYNVPGHVSLKALSIPRRGYSN